MSYLEEFNIYGNKDFILKSVVEEEESYDGQELADVFKLVTLDIESVRFKKDQEILQVLKSLEYKVYKNYLIRNILNVVNQKVSKQIDDFDDINSVYFYANVRVRCYVATINSGDFILLKNKKEHEKEKIENAQNIDFFKYGDFQVFFNGQIEGLVFKEQGQYVLAKVL